MTPIISVIIPVYNVEAYLSKCIESVICQTYTNLEIILVDDGSPDNCGNICDEYAKKDSRIKVIHKENGGLSDARNAGMKIAGGEYLSFIDSDDWVECNYFETLYNLLIDNEADLSAISLGRVNQDGENIGRKQNGAILFFDDLSAMISMYYRDGLPWCAQAKLYKKTLFEGITYPVGVIMEDKATTYKIFAKCKKIVYADLSLYKYLVRQGSIMHSRFSEKTARSFTVQEDLNAFIEQHYPTVATLSHAYTVKVAISMLCRISACDYNDKEFSEKLFSYIKKYKKDFIKSGVVGLRFCLVGFAFIFLRALYGKKIYESKIYKIICRKAASVISTK